MNDQFSKQNSEVFHELDNIKNPITDNIKEASASNATRIDNVEKTLSSLKQVDFEEQKSSKGGKDKILLVGDSQSRNLNLSVIKNITNMEVKRAEAFIISNNDPKAKYPEKNFTDIVPEELKKDNYSTLILQGGTNEVTNLNTSGRIEDKIEGFKKEIKASSENMFKIAEESLKQKKSLKKVIIVT